MHIAKEAINYPEFPDKSKKLKFFATISLLFASYIVGHKDKTLKNKKGG